MFTLRYDVRIHVGLESLIKIKLYKRHFLEKYLTATPQQSMQYLTLFVV